MTRTLLVLSLVVCVALVPSPGRGQTPEADLAKGIGLVEEGDFEVAIPVLDGVARRLAAEKKTKELSKAYLYLAMAYLGLTQEASARARMVDALKSDPDFTPSLKEFPPKLIHIFEEVKRQVVGATPVPRPAADPVTALRFFEAVKLGEFATVRDLLKDYPTLVGQKDQSFGATPLHWAALKGHEAIVGLLLAEGADEKATNRDGETPLQVAERAQRPDVTRILAAADPTQRVFEAARAGDLARVQQIVKQDPGAVRAKDARFGATALHWAALKGYADVAEFLLRSGADPSARNRDGETPLDVAERGGRTGVASVLRQSGATMGGGGAAAIFSAVRAGDLEKVKQLTRADPSVVKEKDAVFGATPLHWAALKGFRDIAAYLLTQGADVSATNGRGETPLQVAERANKADVVALLRQRGATR